ncbi:MAG: glycosyltransferase family 4 protein [candidate division KSB1 bacterium]|nr:glycosyltransferase family 4 protein [candidate division KSB1 bacterium]
MQTPFAGSKPLHILMVAPQPWFQPRGTPFSVLHRIKALSLLGHHIDLVTYPIGQDIQIDRLRIFRAARVPFIKTVKIGPSIPKIFLDIALYRKTVELLQQNRYDYLHTHEEAAFFGIHLAQRFNLPHLYDMHSSLPQQLQNFRFSDSKLLIRWFERLEERAVAASAGVITICPELQNYVESKFPDKVSILIENVADNSIVFPSSPGLEKELRQKYHLDGKIVVLYYGTFEAYQGIDLLIRSAAIAAAGEPRLHFLLVGGNPQQVETYRALAADCGVSGKITFTGFVQPEKIPGFTAVSDILVSPRLKGTNSPLKIYSYLRSGRPIVAVRHITHTQILNESVAELAEPEPQAFAEAILRLTADPKRCRQLAEAARRMAEQHYSYEDYLQKTSWIVEQVMRARS